MDPLLNGDCKQWPLLGNAHNIHVRNNGIVFCVVRAELL
jgi:hypothetical protein